MSHSPARARHGYSMRFMLLMIAISTALIAIAFAENFEGPFFPIASSFVGSAMCARFAWHRFDNTKSGATTMAGCLGATLSMVGVIFITEWAVPTFRDFMDLAEPTPGSFTFIFPPEFVLMLLVKFFILPSMILG